MTTESKAISQIIGILVNEELNAKDAMSALEKAKQTFLERSFHISTKKTDYN